MRPSSRQAQFAHLLASSSGDYICLQSFRTSEVVGSGTMVLLILYTDSGTLADNFLFYGDNLA